MIEGGVEAVTQAGLVTGWVRAQGQGACLVQVMFEGSVVAGGLADAFRADLLAAGHGHGHFGFELRLTRTLPVGPCALLMHLPALGVSAPMAVAVPPHRLAGASTVESLLQPRAGWTAEDLRRHLGCLGLAGHYAGLGAARFVDAIYRFALQRWPTEAEALHQIESLKKFYVTPDELLDELLRSRERADLPAWLMSPFDLEFPFV